MRYRNLSRIPRGALVIGLVLMPAWATLAAAQTGNQSDVTGIPITTSSVVSPVFTVSVGGAVRVITFITPQIAQSYQATSARVNALLSSQTFVNQDGAEPPPTTQNLLYEVSSGGSASADAAARLVAILTANNASPTAVANAEAFVESFRGLLARGIAMDPRFFNSLTATQLANAVAAYNAFVDSSNAGFLAAPPPELAALRSILLDLTRR